MRTFVLPISFVLPLVLAACGGAGGNGTGTGGSSTSTTGTGGTGDSSTSTTGSGGTGGAGGGSTSTTGSGTGGTGGGSTSTTGSGGAGTGQLRVVNFMTNVGTASVFLSDPTSHVVEMPAFASGLTLFGNTLYVPHAVGSFGVSATDAQGNPVPFGSGNATSVTAGVDTTALIYGDSTMSASVTTTDDSTAGLAPGLARTHYANFDPNTQVMDSFDGTTMIVHSDHDVYQGDLAPTWTLSGTNAADESWSFSQADLPMALPTGSVTELLVSSDTNGTFLEVIWPDSTQQRIYAP